MVSEKVLPAFGATKKSFHELAIDVEQLKCHNELALSWAGQS